MENVIRRAFWNLYVPGCAEHYVAHVMRPHGDFVPELDLVLERDGQIIGSIMYTKTRLVDEAGEEKQILTFGPVCILPEYQRMGYGKMLMEASFERAQTMGYEVIVIFGDPANYVGRGFKSCRRFNVCLEGDVFPSAMLVKELVPGTLDGRRWFYHQFVYAIQSQVIPVTPASVKTMAHQTPSMPSQSGRRYKRAPLITMPLRTVSTVDILVRMIDWK